MPNSMTGFGRGIAAGEGLTVICQLRAVNSRFGELNLRMSSRLAAYEPALRRQLQAETGRGKLDATIEVRRSPDATPHFTVDIALAHAYANALHDISKAIDGSFNYVPDPEVIAAYSGVVTEEDALSQEEEEGVNPCLAALFAEAADTALEQFNRNRAAEGERLAADLRAKLEDLEAFRQEALRLTPAAQAAYETRLRTRLETLLGDQDQLLWDEQRIAAEVLLFADKSAIDEELVRLGSHITGAGELLDQDIHEPVGKQLDFLIQEMNRETNTIGSKSSDLDLTNLVVRLKSLVEQIRQQVQNLE